MAAPGRATLTALVAAIASLSIASAGIADAFRLYALAANLASPAHTRARGRFTATLALGRGAATLRWTLGFGGLSGRATAAQIRTGPAGGTLLRLCAPCRPGERGAASVPDGLPLVRELLAGHAYVTVQTAGHPRGEIRGRIRRVSDPLEPG